jgi:hypothetical protein
MIREENVDLKHTTPMSEPRRDPIDEPGSKHGDRVPEVIDPPDPRRHDQPGPDSPRRPEDLPAQEVRDVPAFDPK